MREILCEHKTKNESPIQMNIKSFGVNLPFVMEFADNIYNPIDLMLKIDI